MTHGYISYPQLLCLGRYAKGWKSTLWPDVVQRELPVELLVASNNEAIGSLPFAEG